MTEEERSEIHRRMRILFVARTFPPVIGGIQIYLYNLRRSLAEKAEVRSLIIHMNKFLVILSFPFFILGIIIKVWRWKPDIVYFGTPVLGLPSYFVSRLLRIPTATTIYGLELTRTTPIYRVLIDRFIFWYSSLIAISNASKNLTVRKGIEQTKVPVILPGVNFPETMRLGIQNLPAGLKIEDDYLIYVGRLIPRKGAYWLVDSLAEIILKRHPTIKIVIVGDGPDYSKIKARIESMDLEKSIIMTGAVDDTLLKYLYSEAKAFLMPNIYVEGDAEGFGIVVVEAGMYGIPVVASRLQGIKDALIENETGLFADPMNPHDFADKIDFILSPEWQDPQVKSRISEIVKRIFSWNRVATEYLERFREVCSKGN